MTASETITDFHRLYYQTGTWAYSTNWMGVPVYKCPLDMWVYQDIIYAVKPDLIIETGTAHGGSALFMAHILDLIGQGLVLTIDTLANEKRPQHSRIVYLQGSSIEQVILDAVTVYAKAAKKIMVILDSDHTKDHVLKEMNAYWSYVTQGSYLIVEDTNVNGHPIEWNLGPGPMEAIHEFIASNHHFLVDYTCERYLMTCNSNGYLRRS
jgi:cephalosporin hydroxylase